MRPELKELRDRLRLPVWHRADIDAEIASHLEEAEAELRAQGQDADEARKAALERFGDLGALGQSLYAIHHGWTGGATVRRRFLKTVLTGALLVLAVVLIAVALAGTGAFMVLEGAAASRIATVLVVAWLLLVPGCAAGILWRLGGGKPPPPAPTLVFLTLGTALTALARSVPSSSWLHSSRWLFHPVVMGLAVRDVILLGASNAWGVWLGVLAGRRLGGHASALRLAMVSLVMAALASSAVSLRDRLLPDHGIRRVLSRYGSARDERRYADVAALLTPQYLHRELGSPPYVPKLRAAFDKEWSELDPGRRSMFCLHVPTATHVTNGTRWARVQYHYKTNTMLGGFRFTWDVTMQPWGRTWRIADMHLLEKDGPWIGEGFRFEQGPAGTVRLLSVPAGWRTVINRPGRGNKARDVPRRAE